jgi:hypothetical protein
MVKGVTGLVKYNKDIIVACPMCHKETFGREEDETGQGYCGRCVHIMNSIKARYTPHMNVRYPTESSALNESDGKFAKAIMR